MYGLQGELKRPVDWERANESAVTGHFSHPHSRPWKHVDAPLTPLLAKVLGAQEDEVAHTSTLTSNLHNLFTAFYRPTETRWKIVIEKGSFPSDWVSGLVTE
jgi:kynureninase